jgi:hypothetical protein
MRLNEEVTIKEHGIIEIYKGKGGGRSKKVQTTKPEDDYEEAPGWTQ